MLVRSWNLFHGNTVPPQRAGFLDEMIRVATEDAPDVLCVQEVPAWALDRFTAGDVAARPRAISAGLGRRLTRPNHGFFRSAFTGQGNAILAGPSLRVLAHSSLVLNTRRFRGAQARLLGLGPHARLAWARERRIVQALRLADGGGRTFLVANLHCTSYAADERLADAELLRAASFAVSEAGSDDVVVLAGDFNLRVADSRTLHDLAGAEWGFSEPGPGIDHILVRGAASTPVRHWADEQRAHGDRFLSDHTPVELDIT
ncbi:MAG TPA: endonuclease/exonuclease/phosphatase family protein [Gaiellaceae bacterium]|nr:endonuclease/exonuclease/phosphatase family protein [Gaiellaceae bacterium]